MQYKLCAKFIKLFSEIIWWYSIEYYLCPRIQKGVAQNAFFDLLTQRSRKKAYGE